MMHLREEDVPDKALKNAQKAKIQKQVLRKPELVLKNVRLLAVQ